MREAIAILILQHFQEGFMIDQVEKSRATPKSKANSRPPATPQSGSPLRQAFFKVGPIFLEDDAF